MKLNIRIASLLVVIGIFGFSSVVAQKTTPNKAQPKSGAKSATPKKAKNINSEEAMVPNSQRPPSTGDGNASTRPASTGETLTEVDFIIRSQRILVEIASRVPNTTIKENSGANAVRLKNFSNAASINALRLKDAYFNQNNDPRQYNYSFEIGDLNSMEEVKYWLETALNYLNRIEFGFRNNKADSIDKTQQAIAQAQSYLDNPPAPTKKSPTGTETANPNRTSQSVNGQQQMTNSTEGTTRTKTTNAKPKASGTIKTTSGLKGELTTKTPKKSGKTTKPTNNLDPLDDPWGKTPKKPKTKSNN